MPETHAEWGCLRRQNMRDTDIFLARSCLFLLGVAVLLPWNAVVTAVDYYKEVFPEKHVDRVFSVVCFHSSHSHMPLELCLQDAQQRSTLMRQHTALARQLPGPNSAWMCRPT